MPRKTKGVRLAPAPYATMSLESLEWRRMEGRVIALSD